VEKDLYMIMRILQTNNGTNMRVTLIAYWKNTKPSDILRSMDKMKIP
jgi:hypothetical protein